MKEPFKSMSLKTKSIVIGSVLIFCLLLGGCIYLSISNLAKERTINSLNKEANENLESQREESQETIDFLNGQVSDLRDALDLKDSRIKTLEDEYQSLLDSEKRVNEIVLGMDSTATLDELKRIRSTYRLD